MLDAYRPEASDVRPHESVDRPDAFVEERGASDLPPPPGFTVRDIFVGMDGLRAGWSLLLYVALVLVLLFSIGHLVHAFVHRNDIAKSPAASQPAPRSAKSTIPEQPELMLVSTALIAESISFFAVLVATWIMAKIEHRPTSVYGLGGKRRLHNFLAGLGWGLALLSLLVFLLRATGLLIFDARQLFGVNALRYGAVWLIGLLLVGLFEEYGFRGYLQFTLARGIDGIYHWPRSFGTHDTEWNKTHPSAMGLRTTGHGAFGFWAAAFLLSFGFGFVHRTNAGESPIGLLAAALISVVFCLSLWRTGSLWWAIGFHAAWDWAQSFLYGVADSGVVIQYHLFGTHPVGRPILSGGLTGPEGSLFILPIVGLTAIVIVLTLPSIHRNRPIARSSPTSLD